MASNGAQLVVATLKVIVVRHVGAVAELDGLPIGQLHLLDQSYEQASLLLNQFHRLVEIYVVVKKQRAQRCRCRIVDRHLLLNLISTVSLLNSIFFIQIRFARLVLMQVWLMWSE